MGQQMQNGRAQNSSQGASDQSKDDAFGERVGQQVSAAGTQRGTDSDFARLQNAAYQLQIRQVDADDQQHASDRPKQ